MLITSVTVTSAVYSPDYVSESVYPTSFTGGQLSFARCLVVSWAATLYLHFRVLLPLTEFRHVQNSFCVLQVLRSLVLAALLHSTPAAGSAKLSGVIQLPNIRRGRHLRSAGRSSRWASAHILVSAEPWASAAIHRVTVT